MTKRRIAHIAFMVGFRCREQLTIGAGAVAGCLTVILCSLAAGWLHAMGWLG